MAETFRISSGDLVLDESTGRMLTVSGREKTRQDFGEMLSIEVQDNGWGSDVPSVVGTVPVSPVAATFSVMKRIKDAVARWIGLQRQLRAILEQDELITRLVYNQAVVNPNDPTQIDFVASVNTADGDEVRRGGQIQTGT